jgi:hypothetical protein
MEVSSGEEKRKLSDDEILEKFEIPLDRKTRDAAEHLNKQLTTLSVETLFRRFTI